MKRFFVILSIPVLFFSCSGNADRVYSGTTYLYAGNPGQAWATGDLSIELSFNGDSVFYRHGYLNKDNPKLSWQLQNDRPSVCKKLNDNEFLVQPNDELKGTEGKYVEYNLNIYHHIILEPMDETYKVVVKKFKIEEGVADTSQFTKPFIISKSSF